MKTKDRILELLGRHEATFDGMVIALGANGNPKMQDEIAWALGALKKANKIRPTKQPGRDRHGCNVVVWKSACTT